MFTLLLAFSFAIISCMLSVDSVSSCYSSVISVKSNEEAVKSEIKTKIHEFPVMFCSVFLTRICKMLDIKCVHIDMRDSI